ncbi:MAG TPA: hypothetical protein VFN09_04300 [Rhodanobacteraceae bacterium]|nr:hypothetical protein [Rhodanobacteraceae bacterium]
MAATEVVAGGNHTCAITGKGDVKCWGDNTWGQLGNGSTSDSDVPVDTGGFSEAAQLALGLDFTCVLEGNGDVACWGHNHLGQLGVGNTIDRHSLQTIPGLHYAVAIAAGGYHACALLENGAVKCWGNNTFGEVGDGSSGNVHTSPVGVVGLDHGIVAISLGYNHSCALREDGKVLCWGRNADGQLGAGDNLDRSSPAAVSLPTKVAQVGAGAYHTCARTTHGAAYCWGDGLDGELGNGGTSSSNLPQLVSGLDHGVVTLYGGSYHTCAVDAAGSASCWGENGDGQLAINTYDDATTPQAVQHFPRPIISMAIGDGHGCAADTVGAVMCWGRDSDGQLGNGKHPWLSGPTPYDVVGFMRLDVASVSASDMETCVLTTTGSVACWGYNVLGQLGDKSTTSRSVPVHPYALGYVLPGLHATAISVGGNFACAVLTDGHAWCWGSDYYGELGDGVSGTHRDSPVQVKDLGGIVDISAGFQHTCALISGGSVKCWGYNAYGQLGDGTTTDSLSPIEVIGISNAIAVDAGTNHSCALLASGSVKCWGLNSAGQLGDGTTTDRHSPVAVGSLADITQISAGSDFTCAVQASGKAYCWGAGSEGRLGNGSTDNQSTPVPVSGLSTVSAIAADSWSHACALVTGGAVECWGDSAYGGLGNGSSHTYSALPVDVSNLHSGAIAVAVGALHSCALQDTGTLKCWGFNFYGQLGDGTEHDEYGPVPAVFRGQSIDTQLPTRLGPFASVALNGTSGSGRLLRYETWSPDICVTGGTNVLDVYWTSAATGLCGVRAVEQSGGPMGNSDFAAAPQQRQLIRVGDGIFDDAFE